MRISEAYEHEPILPYQAEECCPMNNCSKVGTQCVEIAEPMIFTPSTVVGNATITCQGEPRVTCVTDAAGTICTVTVTQQICVSVPIRYGVDISCGEPTIACAEDDGCGCGCCR